jgi:hypothetical protein
MGRSGALDLLYRPPILKRVLLRRPLPIMAKIRRYAQVFAAMLCAEINVNQPETSQDLSWREVVRHIRRLFPYIWPSKSRRLQILAVRLRVSVMNSVSNFLIHSAYAY